MSCNSYYYAALAIVSNSYFATRWLPSALLTCSQLSSTEEQAFSFSAFLLACIRQCRQRSSWARIKPLTARSSPFLSLTDLLFFIVQRNCNLGCSASAHWFCSRSVFSEVLLSPLSFRTQVNYIRVSAAFLVNTFETSFLKLFFNQYFSSATYHSPVMGLKPVLLPWC